MCDPISAAALAGTAASAAGGAASSIGIGTLLPLIGSAAAAGINYMGQQQTQAAQQSANDQWVAQQQAASQTALAKDTALRQQASAAMNATLNQVNPASQQANQQGAATSLNAAMMSGNPAAPDSNIAVLGTGPSTGKSSQEQSIDADMAARVTQAARAAQGRIAALAGMQSYGGGYNDMGERAGSAITSGNQQIALTADERQGNLGVLQAAQAIQPVHFVQGSDLAGTIADTLAKSAGAAFASSPTGAGIRNKLNIGQPTSSFA